MLKKPFPGLFQPGKRKARFFDSFVFYDLRSLKTKALPCAALGLLSALVPGAGALFAAPAEAPRDAAELEARIQDLQRQQVETRRRRDSVTAELEAVERKMADLALRLRRLTQERADLEARRKKTQAKLVTLEARLEELRRQLAALVRSAYLGGRARLALLLGSGDPAALQRLLAYHDYLLAARAEKLRVARETATQVAETEAALAREQAELEALLDEHRAERRRLAEQERARRRLLSELDRSLADTQRRIERLRRDARALEAVVARARRALADLEIPGDRPFGQLRGRLAWPVEGRLVVRFGAEKVANLRWDGVIIEAPEGREVRAVRGGRVAWADWLRGYGLLMIIDHGDGYMTLYGHNQALLKQTGDWVTEGEPIALVGRSGGRRRAGLYFGIRHHGKAVNPVRWCRRNRHRGGRRTKSS